VFTSGASEANRLALLGSLAAGSTGCLATSARDHTSLRLAAATAAESGARAVSLPLDASGRLDRSAIQAWLAEHVSCHARILATTLVCGQTGIVENIAAVAAACDESAHVHTDVTQAALTEDLSFLRLGIATLTLAPHKFGGPRGIGALIVRHGQTLSPLQPGTQELGLRGGTEPVVLAAGFARALELAVEERAATRLRLEALRDRFEGALARAGVAWRAIGTDAARAPHISTIIFQGHDRQAVVMAADLAGLCCSTGTACASGSSEPSPALGAMGLPPEAIHGAVRFSLGVHTTADDIDRAVGILTRVLGPNSTPVSRS
jgi:cysteine desulfurase